MNDHIPDVTKMISDTPRMKAAQMTAMEHGTGDVWRVGCDIERELTAANDRIKRLEEAGETLVNHHLRVVYTYYQATAHVAEWLKAKEAKL